MDPSERMVGPLPGDGAAVPRLDPATLDAMGMSVVVIDRGHRIRQANRFLSSWSGKSEAELRGRLCYEALHGRESACEGCQSELAFRTGKPATVMRSATDARGDVSHVEITACPLCDARGEIVAAVESVRDASERARLDEALRATELRYRTVVEHSNDLIWILDRAGNFVWFNRRAEEVSGQPSDTWAGKSFAPLIDPEDLPDVERAFAETLAGHARTYEARCRAPDGRAFVLSVNTTPIVERGEIVGTVSFGEDIPERRRAEDEARRRARELEVLNGILGGVHASRDPVEILRRALDGALRITGPRASGGALLLDDAGTTLRFVAQRGLPARLVEEGHSVRVGEGPCGLAAQSGEVLFSEGAETDLPCACGAERPCAHVVLPLEAGDRILGVLFLCPDPGYRWPADGDHVFAHLGRAIGVALENAMLYQRTDETLQRKVVELSAALGSLERAKAEAEALQRMKDDLVAMLSHDLRSPLSAIVLTTSMLRRRLARSARLDLESALQVVERSSNRIQAMIGDLVDAERLASGKLSLRQESVRLGELVSSVAGVFAEPERRRIRLECSPDVPAVRGDSEWLERAVVNVASNALKYSPEAAPVLVTVGVRANEVLFRVADSGIGIAAEDLPRVGERFWRARGPRKPGAGLGLYITRTVVEAHGGRMLVESRLGHGSTIGFALPAQPAE